MAGQKLKYLREQRRLTVRDVEEASRRIADAAGNARYHISNGWLVQLENRALPPNIYHLFALCATYRVHFFELLRMYDINIKEQAKFEALSNPHLTQLLSADAMHPDLAAPLSTGVQPQLTEKLPVEITFERGNGHSRVIYAQLGAHELTMNPMIRPGAILTIETSQTKIETGTWSNKFERPIYFVELREGFTCGWCERRENKLRIFSYGLSLVKELTYPQEAEVVGRVVAYHTPCVDLNSKQRATGG